MLHWFARRLNELHRVKREERGFTLIELLVVVIIIGILAAIAIPVFLAQREKAWSAQAKSDLRNAATAATVCVAETGDAALCNDAAKLKPYGYRTDTDVAKTMNAPAKDTWTATAQHKKGGDKFFFSTDTGQVTVTT